MNLYFYDAWRVVVTAWIVWAGFHRGADLIRQAEPDHAGLLPLLPLAIGCVLAVPIWLRKPSDY